MIETGKHTGGSREKRIGTLTLLNVALRSLCIQSIFTLQEKLGTGFAFTLLPGLKRIAADRDEYVDLLRRHSGYFNVHPYLVSFVAGAVLKIESAALPAEEKARQIDTLKSRLAGMLGSLGDRLFWKYLKPAASVLSLIALFALESYHPWNAVAAVGVFLVTFNSLHLYYRVYGLIRSYREGGNVIRIKSLLRIEKINYALMCLILFMLGVLMIQYMAAASGGGVRGVIVFLTALAVSFYFNYKKATPWLSLVFGLLSSAAIYFIWKALL